MSSPNSYVKAKRPNMTVLRGRAFQKVLRFNEVINVWPSQIRLVSLTEKEGMPCVHRRKAIENTR
jgi:hypothetical protein